MSRIAVVNHSATGHIYEMADVVKGTKDARAEVRLRRVPSMRPKR